MSAPVGSLEELLRLGEKALDESRWQDAFVLFKTAFEADPTQWRAIQGQSVSLFWMGRREEAWVLAKESYQLAPADPDNEANLRDIAQALGREEEWGQIVSEKTADGLEKDSRSIRVGSGQELTSCDRGERMLGSEKWNDSLPYFLQAIDEDAGQSRAWGGIGISCYRQGWNRAARAFFEMAIRMDATDADSVFNWVELAPPSSSNQDLVLALDGMGVERSLQLKALEVRSK